MDVFAALDGEVLSVEDGNFDRQYGSSMPPSDNHVVLDHGSGRFTIYGHLRRGITLRRGQTGRAGQQLGWTASSGNSS
jgi:murein DD-endopeptidase MepM/ murein hydrolase activator NlpD